MRPVIPAEKPRYVEAKTLASARTAFYWNPPSWARRNGCPIISEALGTSTVKAFARADVLNAWFDAWNKERNGECATTKTVAPGTVHWLVDWFQRQPQFKRLQAKTRYDYARELAMLTDHVMTIDGEQIMVGEVPYRSVRPRHADLIYAELQKGRLGNPDEDRVTTAAKVMKRACRVWNVAFRNDLLDGKKDFNPFAKMELATSGDGKVPPATYGEYRFFVRKADAMGYRSIGTAAMIGWEWLQREEDIFGTIAWTHYAAGVSVKIRHEKTKEMVDQPLADDATGDPFWPELEARLAGTPRRGSLIIIRDRKDKKRREYVPWTTNWLHRVFRDIRDTDMSDQGLPPLRSDLGFSSFRKGGMTELGDFELTDQESMAVSGHKTRAMLTVYEAKTRRQRINATRKRMAKRRTLEREMSGEDRVEPPRP